MTNQIMCATFSKIRKKIPKFQRAT